MKKATKKIVELQKKLRYYKKISVLDELTGLYNRRKLTQDLPRYINLHMRYKIKFSFVMIDINKFKRINDTQGHKTGDKVLQTVAEYLKNKTRISDKVYRIGGDEFIIVFYNRKKIKKVMNRIKKSLQDINISISYGYNDLIKKHYTDILDIIDKKMYKQKKSLYN